MIPLTLPDTGAAPGKVAPPQDAPAEEADGTLFGDLMVMPEDGPVPKEGSFELRLPGSDQTLEKVEIQPDGKAQEADQVTGDSDEAKVIVGRVTAEERIAQTLPFTATTGAPSDINAAKPKTALEDVSLRIRDAPQDRKAANSEGQTKANNVERPSVAQTVLEGRLPQQVPTENPRQGMRAEPNTPQEKKAKAPPALAADAQVIPQKDKIVGQEGTDIKPLHTMPDKKPKRHQESLRDLAGVTVEKAATPNMAPGPSPSVALVQKAMQLSLEHTDKNAKVAIPDDAVAATTTDRLPTVQTATTTPNATPETARQVANQIVVAITNANSKATEISLNPEELGRVRLSLSASDGAITMHIITERAETQDLLRRHLDQLAQEFRALGYSSIAFSFGEQSQKPHTEDVPVEDSTEPETLDDVPQADLAAQRNTTGLDLRI